MDEADCREGSVSTHCEQSRLQSFDVGNAAGSRLSTLDRRGPPDWLRLLLADTEGVSFKVYKVDGYAALSR